MLQLENLSNHQILATNIKQAYSFFKRLKGLMFTESLASGSGLHIKPCQSVHMFFMNYALDILYINDNNIIIAIDESLEPGKIGKRYADAVSVIELPAGTVKETGTTIGQKIKLNEVKGDKQS